MQGTIASKLKKFKLESLIFTDKRINATSQMIIGILAVKCFTWENSIYNKIKLMRNEEQKHLSKITTVFAIIGSFYSFSAIIVPFVAFTIIVFLQNGHFDISTAFFTLAILSTSSLSFSVLFSLALGIYAQLIVSYKRLDGFFNLREPPTIKRTDDHKTSKSAPNGTIEANIEDYGWLIREKETEKARLLNKTEEMKSVMSLHDIAFRVNPGELVGIVGEVGSGKSSLLLALLGEMQNLAELNRANKQLYGSVSYCSQDPWIISETIKENILFGSNYDEEWYKTVINSCSLDVDLEQLGAGDETELGERGINISGGQKARISLARTAYKKTDINLLDDPLSAVDPKVANKLFDACIGNQGIMKDKTRLLMSHQVQFMSRCDRIIIMDSGNYLFKKINLK